MNSICDVDYINTATNCYYDSTTPARITDLVATIGSTNKKIILNWTSVGDNALWGTASNYILKYNTVEITDDNWDSSTTYAQSWTPLVNNQNESKTLTMPNYDYYYFAIKAQDDVGLNSTISNSAHNISPEYNIYVSSMNCTNARTGYLCNYKYAGTTNYFYDTLSLNGSIINAGNIDRQILVEAKLKNSTHESIRNSTTIFVPKESTITLENLILPVYSERHASAYSVRLYVGNSYKEQLNVKFWSIKENTDLKWYDDRLYPNTTQLEDKSFYVGFRMKNNNTQKSYFDYPFKIMINDTFSINTTIGGAQNSCNNENISCIYNLSMQTGYTTEYFFWQLDPLPIGNYNISVAAGQHSNDSPPIISRIIEVQ